MEWKQGMNAGELLTPIADGLNTLKNTLNTFYTALKTQTAFATAAGAMANAQLLAMAAVLQKLIDEIKKLRGGAIGITIAHPYAYGVIAKYDKYTGLMTLSASSALKQTAKSLAWADSTLQYGNTNYDALIFTGSFPWASQFMDIIKAIGNFFNLNELLKRASVLKDKLVQLASSPNVTYQKQVASQNDGVPIKAITQAELLPEYAEALGLAQAFLEAKHQETTAATRAITDLLAAMDDQVKAIGSMVDKVNIAVDKFNTSAKLAGLYYKNLKEMTLAQISEELKKGHLKSWETDEFSIVLGFYSGGAGVSLVCDILGL